MPYAENRLDGTRIYFEDDGGDGPSVVFSGGFLDSTVDVRESELASAIPVAEFRHVYVDHRGLGRSGKPHDPAAYAMHLRVADTMAVLDALDIERAHFVGKSWGARLCFGIAQHAPERVLSIVAGGQQPYEWPDSPLTRVVTEALAACRPNDVEALVEAFEAFWQVSFPATTRARWVDNDAQALRAAVTTVLSEGPVGTNLESWAVPCLIFMGAADVDFLEQARRAAAEIPGAEFLSLDEADHYAAHMSADDVLVDAVLRMLRAQS